MKQSATRIFSVLILVLVGALIALWIKPDGSLRNTIWSPPAPVFPELGAADPLPPATKAVDVNLFVATLERPLFSPSRRPPPPPPPPKTAEESEPPVDPLANIHVFGLYGGGDSPTGMLASVDGKVRRVSVNEVLGGWKLKTIEDRNAIFDKNGEERKLLLVTAKPAPPPKAAVAAAPNAGGAAGAPAVPPPGSVTNESADERRQRVEEQQRERMKRRNEARIRAGAQPITQ